MAKKTFCDGCGKELGNGTPPKLVTVKVCYGPDDATSVDYDLCTRCSDRLKMDADPKRWSRPTHEAPAPVSRG